jgi:hypothetical protein
LSVRGVIAGGMFLERRWDGGMIDKADAKSVGVWV